MLVGNSLMKSVDIILPTYNSEKLIRGSLDSILKSEYEKYRIIIFDDASSDSTVKIIREYQARYPNKLLFFSNEKNVGVTQNAQKCLDATSADIVMFSAHDDLFYPNKISSCVKAFKENPTATLVYHDCDVLIDGKFAMRFSDTHAPKEGPAWKYLVYGCFSTGPSVCVNGHIARSIGYNPNIKNTSDFLLFYEIAKRGGVKYIPEVLGAYCRHGANLSSAIKSTEDFDSIKASIYILEHYKEDRLLSIINLNWTLLKLFSKNKIHLLFYLVSPIISALWIVGQKLGKKRIR
jgi:glycosyltransferase involved in cell wall biosynthesis